MAIPFLQSIDLRQNQILGAVFEKLATGSTPGSPVEGRFFYDTTLKTVKVWNGTAWISVGSGNISNIVATSPLSESVTTLGDGSLESTIAIQAASAVQNGYMSSTQYSIVAGATALNTASAIVARDASGGFTAGTITASLTGTASNAALLNNNNAAYYLSRANHSGTQTASTISDFDTAVRTSSLNQMTAPTGDLSINSHKLTNVATPTADTDAANKLYVDSVAQGFDYKDSVRAASLVDVVVSAPGATIGGVTMASNNRVLLTGQTLPAANGLYKWNGAAVPMTRTIDADNDPNGGEVTNGLFVYVEEGLHANTQWVLATVNPITLGTTDLNFTKFSGASLISAGAGLDKDGNILNVNVDSSFITINGSDQLTFGAGGVVTGVKALINNAGTISYGALDLTTTVTGVLPLANGGTGGATALAARTSLGATTKYAANVGNGTLTSIPVVHNLNTQDVVVSIRETSGSFLTVMPEIQITDVDTVTLVFATAPANAQYRVVVIA